MSHKAGRRLLIVDDHMAVREALADLLRLERYAVACVGDGAEALASLKASRPDAVVLDLQMPVMDGWEFRRRQLADEGLASVPVLVFSSADPGPGRLWEGVPRLTKSCETADLLLELASLCR